MLVLCFAYWRARRKVPWAWGAVAITAFLVINPAKQAWRESVWYANKGSLDRISALGNALTDYYINGRPDLEYYSEGGVQNLNRLCNACIMSRVVEYTPDYVPYLYGSTLMYFLLPRILFPDKPSLEYGNEFGHRYSFISAGDQNTIVSIPWFADLYQNFAGPGVVFGTLLIGAALGALMHFFGSRGVSPLGFCIGIGSAMLVFFAGEAIAIIWGAVLLKILFLAVFFNLFSAYLDFIRSLQLSRPYR
jgi:hypothetical protein